MWTRVEGLIDWEVPTCWYSCHRKRWRKTRSHYWVIMRGLHNLTFWIHPRYQSGLDQQLSVHAIYFLFLLDTSLARVGSRGSPVLGRDNFQICAKENDSRPVESDSNFYFYNDVASQFKQTPYVLFNKTFIRLYLPPLVPQPCVICCWDWKTSLSVLPQSLRNIQ